MESLLALLIAAWAGNVQPEAFGNPQAVAAGESRAADTLGLPGADLRLAQDEKDKKDDDKKEGEGKEKKGKKKEKKEGKEKKEKEDDDDKDEKKGNDKEKGKKDND